MQVQSKLDFDRRALAHRLDAGIKQLPIDLSDLAMERCLRHLELLFEWNRTSNLTAIKDPEQMVVKHVLDSLAAAQFISGGRALDIGTGAGFPGLPLAIAQPSRQWMVLDANRKKVEFIRHVIAFLGLRNVSAHQSRVQQFSTRLRFDTVVCRALGSLKAVAELSARLLNADGSVVALKGLRPDDEIDALPESIQVGVARICIPGLDASRHIVTMKFKDQA